MVSVMARFRRTPTLVAAAIAAALPLAACTQSPSTAPATSRGTASSTSTSRPGTATQPSTTPRRQEKRARWPTGRRIEKAGACACFVQVSPPFSETKIAFASAPEPNPRPQATHRAPPELTARVPAKGDKQAVGKCSRCQVRPRSWLTQKARPTGPVNQVSPTSATSTEPAGRGRDDPAAPGGQRSHRPPLGGRDSARSRRPRAARQR